MQPGPPRGTRVVSKEVLLARLRQASEPEGFLWISVDRNLANNFWNNTTRVGRFSNLAFTLLFLSIPVVWWFKGWIASAVALLSALGLNRFIGSASTQHVRRVVTTIPEAMDALFEARAVVLEWRDPDRAPKADASEVLERFADIVPLLDGRPATSLQDLHRDNVLLRAAAWDGRSWDVRRGPWWQPLLDDGEVLAG